MLDKFIDTLHLGLINIVINLLLIPLIKISPLYKYNLVSQLVCFVCSIDWFLYDVKFIIALNNTRFQGV